MVNFIKRLYSEKPVLMLLLICTLSVIMWIGRGEFYTKGEPREASVALSMIKRNKWVLPDVYAGETAYKPPFTHWITAVLSLPQGKVTPFTARLPSALAFTGMIAVLFICFRRHINKETAFLACLIVLSCIELHRAAMTARVDMMLSGLTVIALVTMFQWEQNKLRGFQVWTVLAMSCATLTKGPVGIIIPLLVFFIYLLLLKYNFVKILVKLVPIALASLVLPAIWYYFAWLEGGESFLNLMWAENLGRFFGQKNLPISYELGHEEGWWYNFMTLAAGFFPWTLLFLFSFDRKMTKIFKLESLSKPFLFSLVSAVTIIVFYCIPLSKRSVYLMPAYPFIAILGAQYILYIKKKKPWLRHLYKIVSIYIVLWIAIDAFVLPFYKNSITEKPFAEQIKQKYPNLLQNLYAVNNLKEYSNMYGLNFYLDSSFSNFEETKPEKGYLLIGKSSFNKIKKRHSNDYQFSLLEKYINQKRLGRWYFSADGEREIFLVSFIKNNDI
ncbi:MAG: glycosyltransferase family 39 protein [Dysgonamonadaceae bacterium]|nr:glycosyltransferase family 39 protein [Dysgonamonadaceae bacterium]